MIKIAVCDDDSKELESLRDFIEKYREKYCEDISIFQYQSPMEFLEIIEDHNFDIVFLDILMPQINGVEVAKEIRKYNSRVKIIFLTSSPEYAVESYSVKAYNYILKPISKDVLRSLLDELILDIQQQDNRNIVIQHKSGIMSIPLSQLEAVEIIGKTLYFYLIDGTVLKKTGKLIDIESSLLCHQEFVKTHRSFIVNMKYIRSLDGKVITSHSGIKILVSKYIYAKFKEEYLEYLFATKEDND